MFLKALTALFRSKLLLITLVAPLSLLLAYPAIHADDLGKQEGERSPFVERTGNEVHVSPPAREPATDEETSIRFEKNPSIPPDITRGNPDSMKLSITFDGGSHSDEATEILDILEARGIKATVFLTGIFIKRYPHITRRIVADGHEVANHLMTHPHLTEYSTTYVQRTLPLVTREYLVKQLRDTEELFTEVTGARMAPLWRAPYGEINRTLRAWAFGAGYLHVGWTQDYRRRESLDTLDWVSDRSSRYYLSSEEMKRRVLDFGKDRDGISGGIILMHLGTQRKTDRAVSMLGELIDELTSRGYRFVKVSTLLEGTEALGKVEGNRKDRHRLISRTEPLDGPS